MHRWSLGELRVETASGGVLNLDFNPLHVELYATPQLIFPPHYLRNLFPGLIELECGEVDRHLRVLYCYDESIAFYNLCEVSVSLVAVMGALGYKC
jgi:hypothetical protein